MSRDQELRAKKAGIERLKREAEDLKKETKYLNDQMDMIDSMEWAFLLILGLAVLVLSNKPL